MTLKCLVRCSVPASYLARVKVAGAVRRNVNVRARAFVESRQAAWGADDDGDAPSDDESVDSEESGLFFLLLCSLLGVTHVSSSL